ncbi:MAG TPA: GGDEF domain-containing protein [Thermoleophilaceae bacterium]|nr:GGDEF domain-containing protein [Thermoleophilaceae bacterium]
MSSLDPLDALLRSVVAEREELARSWLVRVVEEAHSLDEVARLRTDRVADELPELIVELLRAAQGEAAGAGGEIRRRHALRRLTKLRSTESSDPAEPARDLVRLQSVIVEALGSRLEETDPRIAFRAIDLLGRALGGMLTEVVSELADTRSRELEALANTDPLTGLFNLRYLQHKLEYLVGVQERYGHPFGLLVLDIDGLKRINDGFGHSAGDRALIGVADVLRDGLRNVDIPVRMGGDEFCVLAPEQTVSRAQALGERISRAVERIEPPEGIRLSVSTGVAGCPEHGVEPERLLHLADEAMYKSKASGTRVAVGSVARLGPEAASGERGD